MINKVADNNSNIEQTLLIISPIGSRNKSTKIKWIIQDGRKMEILQWWPNMRMKKEPNVVVYLNMKRIKFEVLPWICGTAIGRLHYLGDSQNYLQLSEGA